MVDDIGEYMIPILFEGNETSFTSNGIGRLSDAITCVVTEKRNGAYELEMQYPIDGVHFNDIIYGRYILAKPAKYSQNQPFEIYQISKPLKGVCTICAYHISYRLAMIPVMPFYTNSITAALNGLKTNAAETNPFNFSTTKTTVANYNQTEPRDARSCLGGVQGSILDVFGGGEYEFDMFNVKLWQDRGQNRGFEIRYGKNLIDLKQETNIENTITGIVPYYKNESSTITLPEKVIETASAANFPYPRSVPVDLSSEFQETVPTVAQLRAAGNAYIASHEIGVPKVSLTVSFVNLADTKGYEDIAVLEDIRLCDTVRVVFDKLGVDALAKVISTEYDTLKEKFQKIELGSSPISLATRIAAQEKVTEEQTSALQEAINRATNLITGVSGGYVVMHTGDDGKPYEILIMDNEDINQAVHVWRWNQNGWGYSGNGYNGTYRLAATIDGGIVADFITTGKLIGLEIDNGNGTFHVDSAGHMKATSGEFTGDVTGSTITGSSMATTEENNYSLQMIGSSLIFKKNGTIIGMLKGGHSSILGETIYADGSIWMDKLQCTGIEISQATPYIDFHYGSTATLDYTTRIIASSSTSMNFTTPTGYADCYGNFINQSSRVIKTDVESISEEDALKVLDLRPVNFKYRYDNKTQKHGLIAEEVLKIYPDLVHVPDGWIEEKYEYKDFMDVVPSLDYGSFVPYLIKMIQIQQHQINELKNSIKMKGK